MYTHVLTCKQIKSYACEVFILAVLLLVWAKNPGLRTEEVLS